MAAKNDLANCFNHPKARAVGQCVNCRKPLCESCLSYREGGVYCGDSCFKEFQKAAAGMKKRLERSRQGGEFVPKTIRLLIVAAIILAALEWLGYVNVVPFI